MRKQIKVTIFFFLIIICIDVAFAQNAVRVFAKVYEIPPYLSTIVFGVQNKDGSVSGGVIGGNVTASFPDGVVILDGYFAKDLPDNAVKEAIRGKVRWPCGEAVNRHLKVYQFWESKSVPPDGVERAYAGKVDTISPPSLGYDLLKPWSFNR